MTKSEVKTLTKRLQKSINENDFLLDGVDSETSFSNGKTLAFVNKLGIDATLQMLEDIISEENYFKFSEAKSWWEDDAHVYVDRHAVSQ